jgi:hypothetical protein
VRGLVVAVLLLLVLPTTALAQAPPGRPESVNVVPRDGSVEVTWVAPADAAAVTGYTVTTTPAGPSVTVAGTERSAVVAGLANGTAYRFSVVATGAAGTGPPSAVSNTVTPSAAAVPDPGAVLFAENFGTSPGGMTAVAGGSWDVASGRYVLSAPADGGEGVPNANLAVHATPVPGDFTLRVTASVVATDSPFNDFSVVYGYRDPANYAFASFSESNDDAISGVFTVAGGVRTQIADIVTPITAGVAYPVRVQRSGPTVRVYLGDAVVATVDDPSPGGQVGVGSRNDATSFDDLVVTAPAAPPAPAAEPGLLARFWARLTSWW